MNLSPRHWAPNKLNSICPNSVCDIFSDQMSAYNLRQSDFSTPRYSTVTQYGRHSLPYLGPKLWGKLPTADRSAKTLTPFTNRLRKSDIDIIIYT